jgi:hypothetical protein
LVFANTSKSLFASFMSRDGYFSAGDNHKTAFYSS